LKRAKKATQKPVEIMYELCGQPPLLATEEEKDFAKVANGIIEFVEPTNAIEWLYTNDAICYAFEIRRYRRIKVGLMERYNIQYFSSENADAQAGDDEDGDDQYANDHDGGHVVGDKAYDYRTWAKLDAELFSACSSDFELADRLETVAQVRLARVLSQIDDRRASFREKLQLASTRLISEQCETKSQDRRRNRPSAAARQAGKLGSNRGVTRRSVKNSAG
jgi:hypothetical protein